MSSTYPVWECAVAVLLHAKRSLKYDEIASRIKLSGLHTFKTQTPGQSTGKLMRDKPEWFGYDDGYYRLRNPEQAIARFERVYLAYQIGLSDGQGPASDISTLLSDRQQPPGKDVIREVKTRLGQGEFRDIILKFWEGRCCLTGLDDATVLVASHIKPWRYSDEKEKTCRFNGLLLTPNLDYLFDRLLISFSDSGDLIKAGRLNNDVFLAFGGTLDMKLPFVAPDHIPFIRYHRRLFIEQNCPF